MIGGQKCITCSDCFNSACLYATYFANVRTCISYVYVTNCISDNLIMTSWPTENLKPIIRAIAVTVLYRLCCDIGTYYTHAINDVSSSLPYYNAICWSVLFYCITNGVANIFS